ADKGVVVFGGAFLFGNTLVVTQVFFGNPHAADGGLVVDIGAADGEVNCVEYSRMVDFEPHEPDGRHQVGHGVGFGEHILDLAARFNVPIRHIMLPHRFLPAGLEATLRDLPFTHGLHDIEGS